ncbi:discoidin domain-containing protein [Phycicoccus sp. CSK15P-2]|uniref:galactose-binding domain-containing protein n=1 Tax=Phycicoccus sp. CSK15P-2 TaxID=2807627 RepID=UPI00194FBA4D|nr:discoidin domain-containing protein [Phycicoccus sp. CSK15P-2]MBM6402960.1 discoidin domain-containing protein [Phycicoccus sp. CSK15P-2]
MYSFTVPEGGRTVVFDGSGHAVDGTFSKVLDASGTSLGTVGGHQVKELPAGEYQLVVERPGYVGTYTVNVDALPDTSGLDNVARGKTATSSSTAAGGVPGRAVDGVTDGNWGVGSVIHTNYEEHAWWQVDLGDVADIESVHLWNRTDCCSDRTTDFWLFVSEEPFDTALSPGEQATQPGVWSSHQSGQMGAPTVIDVPTSGRYVMVQLAGANYLHFAEAEVFTTAAS